jgi:hypothetical protein
MIEGCSYGARKLLLISFDEAEERTDVAGPFEPEQLNLPHPDRCAKPLEVATVL